MRGSPVRVRLSALYGAKSQSDLALLLLSKIAELAQLVEHWLPKPRVAGSSPVFRSTFRKISGDVKKVSEKFAGVK